MICRSAILSLAFTMLATSAVATEGPPRMVTGLIEGYAGAGILTDGDPVWGFNGGGAGSLVFRPSIVYLQLDVFGDYNDPIVPLSNVGGGGHLGVVGSELGLIGVSGAYNHFDFDGFDFDQGRVGGEGELFLGPVTLGVVGGYWFEPDISIGGDDGYYARGLIRGYVRENLKLEGIGGVTKLGETVAVARALVEYRAPDLPVSFFTRWEGGFPGGNAIDTHLAVAGFRLYFDDATSLRQADRVYFRDSCMFDPLGVRGC